jgi:hypothetical protein
MMSLGIIPMTNIAKELGYGARVARMPWEEGVPMWRHSQGAAQSRVLTPKQALETDSAASCEVLYPCLYGIIQLTNSDV